MNPAPVLRLDLAGRVALANRAARTVFGREDLQGHSWLRICPGMGTALWRRVLSAPQPVQHEVTLGALRILFTHVRSTDSAFVFAFGADVTQQRQNERLLEEQAANLAIQARFPDMNPGPVLRLKLDSTILLANKAAAAVFGRDLAGLRWIDLLSPLDAARWDEIVAAREPIYIEAAIDDRVWVFAHRRDHESELVFAYGADITYQKQTERALRQSEKMATLGTLVAGVAHELNNPAAAAGRASAQLRDAIARLEQLHVHLEAVGLTPAMRDVLVEIDGLARDRAGASSQFGALEQSDLEASVEEWLDERAIEEAWVIAPPLVELGFDPNALSAIEARFSGRALAAVLNWMAGIFHVYALLNEVNQGSTRISEIVRALKSYSYLGQAPILEVDLHEGLDNTLVILRSKLKAGVTVEREYAADLPPVTAYGSELNQVWTNLLDNAVDAMGGRGHITIRTSRDGPWAVVEIEDGGPGIPEAIQARVFDPFFTTKEPGQGTGLGLSTSFSIITEKHKGQLSLVSRPGLTVFTVKLPIAGPPVGVSK